MFTLNSYFHYLLIEIIHEDMLPLYHRLKACQHARLTQADPALDPEDTQ